MRLIRHYAWRYRASYLAGVVFVRLTNYLSVSIPGEIGRAIDALRASAPVGSHMLAIAAMGVAVIGVRTLSRILIFNPARHLEYNLRGDLFAKLLRLQPSFYARHKRGDIVSRASNDISWVRTLVGYGGLQIINVTIGRGADRLEDGLVVAAADAARAGCPILRRNRRGAAGDPRLFEPQPAQPGAARRDLGARPRQPAGHGDDPGIRRRGCVRRALREAQRRSG